MKSLDSIPSITKKKRKDICSSCDCLSSVFAQVLISGENSENTGERRNGIRRGRPEGQQVHSHCAQSHLAAHASGQEENWAKPNPSPHGRANSPRGPWLGGSKPHQQQTNEVRAKMWDSILQVILYLDSQMRQIIGFSPWDVFLLDMRF